MQVLTFSDAGTFAERVLPWIARDPIANNVLATTVQAVVAGQRSYANALWLTVTDDAGDLAGAAMQTPPHALFLGPMAGPMVGPMVGTAVGALVEAVLELRPTLHGVNGVVAAAFAAEWAGRSEATATLGRELRLCALDTVVPPPPVPGECRPATPADRSLLLGWSLAFHHETAPAHPPDGLAEVVDSRLAAGAYLLWSVEGRAVCFAGVSPPVAGVARIGPVYTPPADRRRGYAGACVAAATQLALDGGARQDMLYTDLANPTSNAIYQRIGYRPVCDAHEYAFSYPPTR